MLSCPVQLSPVARPLCWEVILVSGATLGFNNALQGTTVRFVPRKCICELIKIDRYFNWHRCDFSLHSENMCFFVLSVGPTGMKVT